jgi:predicted RNase H-like HicB family nuclease
MEQKKMMKKAAFHRVPFAKFAGGFSMKYVYPAIFTPAAEGYRVRIPDLPGLLTFGETLCDALEMAQDTTEMWLWNAEVKSEYIPPASTVEEVEELLTDRFQFVTLIVADTYQYRRQHDNRAVKKTLSIPSWLNYEAEKANAPFSQLLQQALQVYLAKKNI